MKVAQIKFAPWDKIYNFSCDEVGFEVGDMVVVETDMGMEIGKIISFLDAEFLGSEEDLKPVLRKASDFELAKRNNPKEKQEALELAKSIKENYNLPMKFVDVHFSYDDSKITFAFIADGRVDFRELVKDLTRNFNRSIRLQQIGIRDEAKIMGDFGPCGRPLCCKTHLKNLESISSEMADLQQCAHRGSDRISGICGRLMCCLAYEQKGYEELAKKMPPIGTKVNVDGKRGTIVGHNVLKQSVKVSFLTEKEGETIIAEVDLNRHKK